MSHQLRLLEAQLEVTLFDRTESGLVPTEKGRQLLPKLTEGFQVISDGLSAVADRPQSFLTVSCGLAFAARFLVHRLVHWTAEHPDVEIRLVTTSRRVEFDREDIDIAVRFGKGSWPNVKTEKIADQPIELVCAPRLGQAFTAPETDSPIPLIVDEQSLVTWSQWSENIGDDLLEPSRHPKVRVPDASLAYEAAVSGQGLWLAWPILTQDAVASGMLTRPDVPRWDAGLGFWAVSTPSRWRRPHVREFRAWLRRTCAMVA